MKNPTSRWWAIASSMLALGGPAGLVGLAVATSGCGEESAETDPTTSGGGATPAAGPTTGPGSGGNDPGAGGSTPDGCEPGEVRACEIPVGTQNGVLTCIAGQEACRSNGTWGPCEGSIFARSAEGLPDGLRGEQLRDPAVVEGWRASRMSSAMSLASIGARFPGDDGAAHRAETDTEECDSPCDPDCQAFPNPLDPEVPDSEIDQEPIGGSLLEFIEAVASGLLDKLFPDSDSCDSAADCNVDSNCNDDDDLTNESDSDTTGCDAWGAGEYDDEAGGYDFTVGSACGSAGSQKLPVCNRGTGTYVGNLVAWISEANSDKIGTCTMGTEAPKKTCTFAADLGPGECMELPATCWSGVTGNNKAVYINPTGSNPPTTPVAEGPGKECNNWGFWDKDVPCASCTDSWETELDEDDDDGGSFCSVFWDMDVDVLADDRMIYLEYRSADNASWQPVTWVWNDRWEDNTYEEDGCSGGAQAVIYEHVYFGDLHYHARLCDDLCDEAVGDTDPALRFTYDCPRTFEDELVGSVVYQGICPEATRVQWGYLGFNGVTPGNSRIELEGRTGTADPPTDGDWIDLATARDDYSGDEVSPACLLTDPDDECPVDLYAAFDGAPDATQEFLEVQYTLVSSGDNDVAPRLYELYATFTCPDSE